MRVRYKVNNHGDGLFDKVGKRCHGKRLKHGSGNTVSI